MVDQNKFINTYIDIIVNTLLEQIKSNLQLQTQVKVHEFVVADKDQIVASLTQQLSENKVAEDWKVKYEAAETNYSAILGKVKHMDTLLAQVGEMKNIIAGKDGEISNLNTRINELVSNLDARTKELEELKASMPTKVINTKVKKKAEEPVKETEKTLDDF